MYEYFKSGNFRDIDPYPVVNIGREFRVSIEDGRHRLCLAKLLEVESIKVKVANVHQDLFNSRIKRFFLFGFNDFFSG